MEFFQFALQRRGFLFALCTQSSAGPLLLRTQFDHRGDAAVAQQQDLTGHAVHRSSLLSQYGSTRWFRVSITQPRPFQTDLGGFGGLQTKMTPPIGASIGLEASFVIVVIGIVEVNEPKL